MKCIDLAIKHLREKEEQERKEEAKLCHATFHATDGKHGWRCQFAHEYSCSWPDCDEPCLKRDQEKCPLYQHEKKLGRLKGWEDWEAKKGE